MDFKSHMCACQNNFMTFGFLKTMKLYHTISFQEYRNYEIVCGNILDVIRTTNIEDLSKDLRLNWSSCREKAFVILITNLVSLSFLIILLIYLVYIYKNRKEREDISDLLTILKRMNRK